jgi:hypothetical protein
MTLAISIYEPSILTIIDYYFYKIIKDFFKCYSAFDRV